MNTQLVNFEAPELKLVELSKATQIKETFLPMAIELQEFDSRFKEIILEAKKGITPEVSAKAKRLRLDIVPTRSKIRDAKDLMKSDLKLYDKAIMGVHNLLILESKEYENPLSAIEKHAELLEQNRLEALQVERVKKMLPYIDDAENRKFSDMEDDVFEAYFQSRKQAHFDLIRIEEESRKRQLAEQKAEAKERKRIAEENARLKAASEAFEKKAEEERKERNELEAKRIAKEALEQAQRLREFNSEKAKRKAEQKAREQKETEAENERARLQHIANLKHEAQLKIERDKATKLEAEKLANEKALEDIQKAKEASLQAELSKGDADKVKDLISDLTALKTKYTFKSKTNQKMFVSVCGLIDKVLMFVIKK
jgi:hypothetical protein